jgi:hypothetical protein
MPDAPNIIKGHMATCMKIRCRFHAKQARYQIKFYPDDNLLVVSCLECPPGEEILRATLAKKGEN